MIEVKDVYYSYPSGIEALSGVTVTICDREFVAIMGENGAGKSTLVKHFNGILKPSKGQVTVDGVATTKESVAQLSRNVGLVFQNPDHQLFSETVEEEVAFGLRNFGYRDKEIDERTTRVLDLLDLAKYRKASPFILSGGERKRVALASVLAWDPKVVVLDEPTVGQDYRQKERLRQFVLKLNEEDRSVVMVTHDVEFVADCSPRVIVMSHGRIVGDGDADDILTDEALLTKASVLPPQVTQLLWQLSDLGLPRNVLDLNKAKKLLDNVMGVRTGG
ncbi:energy-coupling factor ABC transporter ATP-binding protein [Candidatus Bathyarchaeota archaeon]|jgi:energy-coupling factor transport system ATP-binding protein|nr:energy-coupling factor ABC transporter ATP-binding protein [Candidatus Bathyarchaeota archaeon]